MNGCYTIGMILGLLLVAGSVVAGVEDVIEIDAPGILDVPGATYVLTKDVTTERTAFMIKGDGNRFTLRNGRLIQGRQPLADKLSLRAGRVVQAAGPVPGRSCFVVYVRGCRGLEISDLITEVNSRDTDNLYIRECADVHIHDNHCISSVREITDRHWPGTGVITVAGVRGPMDIHRNVIDGGGQWGIRVSGGEGLTGHLVQVHHNFCRVVAEEGSGDADPLDFDCPAYSCNRVYKNTIEAIRRSDNYWAASINVIRAKPSNLAAVHDNVFRTNHWHLRTTT